MRRVFSRITPTEIEVEGDPTKPVAGYFRVSQARDVMSAPDIYRDEIERFCRYKDLRLDEIFSDIDYSGYRGARRRPGLEALKQQRSLFSAIVIPGLRGFPSWDRGHNS